MTANGLRSYLKRFFTQWITEDPDPRYSALDLWNGHGWTMGDIGEPKREIVVEPIEEPAKAPQKTEPEKVPA